MDQFSGPIPGENYTSDTKNYAWHRPPEFVDLDDAIEYIGKRLTSEESYGMLSMMESGIPLTDLTQMFLMSGVGAGKWTLDFALMLAGPTAHIMSLMGKGYGIKYELGLDDAKSNYPPSMAFRQAVHEINRGKAQAAGRRVLDAIDDIEANTNQLFKEGNIQNTTPAPQFRGFMSAPNPRAQEAMLGETPDQEQQAEMPEQGIM